MGAKTNIQYTIYLDKESKKYFDTFSKVEKINLGYMYRKIVSHAMYMSLNGDDPEVVRRILSEYLLTESEEIQNLAKTLSVDSTEYNDLINKYILGL